MLFSAVSLPLRCVAKNGSLSVYEIDNSMSSVVTKGREISLSVEDRRLRRRSLRRGDQDLFRDVVCCFGEGLVRSGRCCQDRFLPVDAAVELPRPGVALSDG